ncbi:hypothetical protein [Synechococcus sp. PCC 7336]|uniref:hypothetical protein n=1 Tax=Synechococcus sp. PCC 7336 TaxID=195250 RepID=UPI0012EACD1C|nr:hypothetical protein [Synechococcus sp. PCC 7336]
MASPERVKAYVACWLQMGKAVDIDRRDRLQQLKPQSILSADGYSAEFERNWRFMYRNAGRCYLSGTNESIEELLANRWDIEACSRCDLLVPLPASVSASGTGPCPCADIDSWPDLDSLKPRLDTAEMPLPPTSLHRVQKRLQAVGA